MNVLQAGDNVLFKRGDTFRGKLYITTTAATQANKITFGAYGTGPNPIIKGSNVVSGWTASGQPNIWYATYNQPVEHVYKNGQLLTVARYPNTGVRTVTSTGNTTSFTDNTLGQPTNYFKDATVHMRTINWQWEKRVVSSSSPAGVIAYGPTPTQYTIQNGWGYYFDNKLSFLDAPNEWFYEASTNRLYLYSTTNPAADLLEAPAIDYGINLEWGRNNIIIQDFDVRQNTEYGIYFNKSQFSTITRCKVSQILKTGMLTFDGSNNNTITYNIVEDILSTGIQWDGQNETITHNTIRRIGLVPGYGTTDYGDYGMTTGKSTYVAYNVVEDIANGGIGLNGMGTIAEFNTVNNACAVMNDSGGMTMAWGSDGGIDAILRHNIITNVEGGTFGAPPNNPPIANGIYYGGKDNVNITTFNNTIANCNGLGISMLDTKDSFALNNTIYNCSNGIANMELELPAYPINNNTITNNVIYGLNDKQLLYNFKNEQGTSVPNNYNISENNYLHNPYSDIVFRTQVKINGGFPTIHYTLDRLKAERQHDLNSKSSFVKLTGFKAAVATSANLIANGNFDANLNGWGMNQNFYSIFVRDPNRAGMTGGSLKFRNNQDQYTQPLVAFTIANNTASQWYRLKFSIIGDTPNVVAVGISNNNSPWNGLTEEKRFAINTTVSNHEYFFQLPAGPLNVRAGFRIIDETSAVYTNWLDNVVVEAVNVTPDIAPELRSPIFINPTNANVNVSLQGKTYRDLDGNYICGNTISIAPFSSKILILEDDEVIELPINSIANLPVQNISGVNQCRWFHVDNADLRLASVNPQGNDLQNVGVQTFLDTTIRTISGKKALGRNWTVSASAAAGSAAKLRLYFTQAEFDALNAASPLINTVNDLVLTSYTGTTQDNIWCNNVGGTIARIPATFTAYQNGYYAEFSSNTNAEFWLSENFVVAPLSNTVPTFNPIAPVCAGTALAPLPTTSTNNIEGSWSPALNNMATTTYTFTPFYGSCSATTTLTITVGCITIWNGTSWSNGIPTSALNAIIDGNYTGPSFTALSVTVNPTFTLTINSGQTVTTGNLTNNGAVIVNNEGNLIQTVAGTYSGTGTFKVNKNGISALNKYALWSSPVVAQNLTTLYGAGITPAFITEYNTATDFFVNAASTTSVAGKGYAIKTPVANASALFTGVPHNGTQIYTLATTGNGFNLVGNPYPSNLNLNNFYTANAGRITNTLYFWDNTSNSVTTQAGATTTNIGYATYNPMTQAWVPAPNIAAVPTGNVAPIAQAFIVKTLSASVDTSLNFTNDMRTDTSGTFFNKNNSSTEGKFWLRMSSSYNTNNTLAVAYLAPASDAYDNYDSKAMATGSDAFYTMADAQKVLIQGKAAFDPDDVVPVGTKHFENGNFVISLVQKEGIFNNGQAIYLHDKVSGTYTNLQNGTYSFTANSGEFTNRFEIVYKLDVLATSEVEKNGFEVYRDGEDFYVRNSKNIETVMVFDAAGRKIMQIDAHSKLVLVKLDAGGMYIIKAVSGGKEYSKKIIK